MRAPLVQAEQHRAVRVEDLTEVVMAGGVAGWPNSDWYHLKLAGTSRTPMIVHVRFIAFVLRLSTSAANHIENCRISVKLAGAAGMALFMQIPVRGRQTTLAVHGCCGFRDIPAHRTAIQQPPFSRPVRFRARNEPTR